MQKQTLPNSILILIFGILSIISCCCYGIGIIFGIIAWVMAGKATRTYLASPEIYSGYQNVRIGKILAIVGVILNIIYLGYIVYLVATIGIDGILEMSREMMEQYQ